MRKLILSMVLASTAAMPAVAQDQGGRRDRGNPSASTDDGESARPARTVRAERAERQRSISEPARESRTERVRVQRDDGATAAAATTAEAPRRQRFVRPADGVVPTQVTRERRADSSTGRVIQTRRAPRTDGVEIHRDGTRTPDRTETSRHRDGDRQWSSHWRSDRRYDWRRYRDQNRSIFRIGRYYDPYGYDYRRFSIGFSLWPSYYGSSFWLDDPWQYRLPPAYGPYRWIRYYDDALLVNIYTGQVVDVERNFFWYR